MEAFRNDEAVQNRLDTAHPMQYRQTCDALAVNNSLEEERDRLSCKNMQNYRINKYSVTLMNLFFGNIATVASAFPMGQNMQSVCNCSTTRLWWLECSKGEEFGKSF